MTAKTVRKSEIVHGGTGVGGPRLGQYVGIRRQFTRQIGPTVFIIAIYGAYDVFGMIGSERNGIVILNDTKKQVVADHIAPIDSGFYGETAAQIAEYTALRDTVSGAKFLERIAQYPRFRGHHTITSSPA